MPKIEYKSIKFQQKSLELINLVNQVVEEYQAQGYELTLRQAYYASGRTSLWSDLVKIRTQLQELGAIEGFTDSDVTVAQGDSKKAVVITSAITVVNAMGKLYETVTVA